MKRIVCAALVWGVASIAHAAPLTPQQAFEEAKGLAASAQAGAVSDLSNGKVAETIDQFNPTYYNSNGTAPESRLFQGGNGDTAPAGQAKVAECQNGAPNPDPFLQQNCDAINFMAKNPSNRPQFTIPPELLASSRAIQKQGVGNLGLGVGTGATGTFTSCVEKTTSPPPTTEVCSEWFGVNNQQCAIGRTIQVAANTNYQCDKTADVYESLKCRRRSDVTCTGGGTGCDRGGIVPNSWAGDMATSFKPDGAGNYILSFGTFADNYWGGWGAVYDRTLNFEVKNVDLISTFALTRAAFDDWLLVKVNGATVYVGPYGGDRLKIYSPPPVFQSSSTRVCKLNYGGWFSSWDCYDKPTGWGWGGGGYTNWISFQSCSVVGGGWSCTPHDNRTGLVQYCATCFGRPELSVSWNIGLNIDVRPYLKNGTNTVFMRTIVAGLGEGAIRFTTRQVCPLNCSVSTSNECASLEARAQ